MGSRAKIKLCPYCHELFAPKKNANQRRYCYKPACIAEHEEIIRQSKIEQIRRWHKHPNRSYRQGRPRDAVKRKGYALCGHKSTNYFNCDRCRAQFSSVYNEDWLYDCEEAVVYV